MSTAGAPSSASRRVVIVAYQGVQALDVTGPFEVFAGANSWASERCYDISVVSASGGSVTTESGLRIDSEPLPDPSAGTPIDTLVVAGGTGVHDARTDEQLVTWLENAAARSRRVASVCSGAFLLGELGLLDGRRVTTHWARARRLAETFPAAIVDPEPIHLHDGVWTSAGVTAGIDLALALVTEDHGAGCAQTIAQWLVMFLRRPGGQSQFAAPVWTPTPNHDGVRRALDEINADPSQRHSMHDLATVAAMSPRHFSRVFTREVGCAPGRYVELRRVDAARGHLEQTTDNVEAIAARCGFGSSETMRRAFVRQVGVAPASYRQRFAHAP
ncbi:MAG: helix-turn-helix domain-containing protein [Actinomycetota bacterium]